MRELAADDREGQALSLLYSKYKDATIMATVDHIIKLIEQERVLLGADTALNRIMLGGCSQGTIVTLATLMRIHERYDEPLGAAIC